MTCSVRLESLEALKLAIMQAIPELTDMICVGQADPSHALALPHLTIDPVRWEFMPYQAEEKSSPGFDKVVVDVGTHEGIVQLTIGAENLGQRAIIEAKLLDLFLRQELAPGVLVTVVQSCPELGEWEAAWELDEDEWQDQSAFDGKFYSRISVNGVIPALTIRQGFPMENLQVQTELDEQFTETVRVNEDGTITPVP